MLMAVRNPTVVKIVVCSSIILTSLISHILAQQCVHGEIRLARNSTPFEGGIDVCVNNSVWGTVCNDFWGTNEIQVACRQLGFQVSGTESLIDLIIEGGPDVVIDNINCTGNEQSLTDCTFSFEVSDCLGNVTHKVGVRCHEERPPRNVSLLASETLLTITWMQPPIGMTNLPVLGYNIECTTTGMNTNIVYKASGATDNTTNTITIPINSVLPNSVSAYNCCVEVVYETYSSIACAIERSIQLASEVNIIDQEAAAYSSLNASVLAGVLGVIIVILTLLLVVTLFGMLHMHRKMQQTMIKMKMNRKRTLSSGRYSTSDEPEHVVDNPTYGESESAGDHSSNMEDGAELYGRTGPHYEPITREPNSEGYTSQEEETTQNLEGLYHERTSFDSVQI